MKFKERHNLIRQLRNAGLSFETVRELGFKVSKSLWTKCLDNFKRNQGKKIIFNFYFGSLTSNIIIIKIKNKVEDQPIII